MEPRLDICIFVENNRRKSIQVWGTWHPPYKLTASWRHYFWHHRPSLYSVHVRILLHGLLTHGLMLWLTARKCQCWVGHDSCQDGAWLGFLLGETSRRCCGPWKHLKHSVWWGKGEKWTPHTIENGPSRPPSVDSHGNAGVHSNRELWGGQQGSWGVWGAPAVQSGIRWSHMGDLLLQVQQGGLWRPQPTSPAVAQYETVSCFREEVWRRALSGAWSNPKQTTCSSLM